MKCGKCGHNVYYDELFDEIGNAVVFKKPLCKEKVLSIILALHHRVEILENKR